MIYKTPAFRLSVNGNDITRTVNNRLISLSMTDNRGDEADEFELQLTDHDGLLGIPPRGASVQIWLGYEGETLINKGLFTVDEISHSGSPDILQICGRSADFRGSLKRKREQSWHNTTVNDMVQAIATRNELTAVISSSLAQLAIAHVDQTNESDISFMTRMAKRFGATATVKAGKLLFITQGSGTTASGQAVPAVTISRTQGDQHRYALVDRDNEYTGVQANWNDKKGARLHAEIAGDTDNPKVLRHTYRSATEARQAAEAEWERIQRQTARFELTLAIGDPSLYPETPVTLSGWKPVISSTPWLITRVVHEMGDGGYTCRVEMEEKAAE